MRVLSNLVFSLKVSGIGMLTSHFDNSNWFGLVCDYQSPLKLIFPHVSSLVVLLFSPFFILKVIFSPRSAMIITELVQMKLRRKHRNSATTACRKPRVLIPIVVRISEFGHACPSNICDCHRWYHCCCFRLQRGQYYVCLLPNLLNYG